MAVNPTTDIIYGESSCRARITVIGKFVIYLRALVIAIIYK